jgi:hypothetical protein
MGLLGLGYAFDVRVGDAVFVLSSYSGVCQQGFDLEAW